MRKYVLYLTQKITKKKHTFFPLESTNSFTIYSSETTLNVLFRFSQKICFWKGNFLTNFSPFSPTDCIFLNYYETRFGIYPALSVNTISVFSNFLFHSKYPVKWLTVLSPVTSTNVRFDPQNFLTFSFNLFAILVQNFKFVHSTSPKLLNLNQDHPSRKVIFLV